MQASSKPGKGWLIDSHAVAVMLGASGILIVNKASERTVVVKPMLDLGNGELIPLGQLFGGARGEARISANENAAIATLRSIAAAQQQFQASCAVDTDTDGGGEFGFFGELSGAVPMRIYASNAQAPALGLVGADELDPPYLATAFGNVVPDGAAEGLIERQGYYYKIYLPGRTAGAITPGMAEAAAGGARRSDMGAAWGSANCEIFWCAYAWPVDAGTTGNRAFFINQEGNQMQCDNRHRTYEGLRKVPTFGAAYSDATPNNMEEDLGLAIMGFVTNDGNIWTAVGS